MICVTKAVLFALAAIFILVRLFKLLYQLVGFSKNNLFIILFLYFSIIFLNKYKKKKKEK